MKRNSLPGAESEPVMRRNSLTAQFVRLLLGAGDRVLYPVSGAADGAGFWDHLLRPAQ